MAGERETRLREAMAVLDLHDGETSIPHVRALLQSAQLRDALEEAIEGWEAWVRDQLDGTTKFSSAMADIDRVRSVLSDADARARAT
jgi:hypothetical protein